MQAQEQQQQQQGPVLQHDIGPEAWHALSHIRQALQFLVLQHKGSLSLEELASQVCPSLSHQQLYRLCTTAWDEAPGDGEHARASHAVLLTQAAAHPRL
ncbi:hypothetical protein COO60DRAFT_1530928 [Scenedesmus sp. NREL 46B-D3]|nr:hypothetical protein COO60DRAFT_1530928 [Scenedesmus sp. NREL 46B-D3]